MRVFQNIKGEMNKTLFCFLGFLLSLIALSESLDSIDNDVHHPKLKYSPEELPPECRKALVDLKTCSGRIHEIFVGKNQDHVRNICCKSIVEFERSCFHHGVPHFVFPHWLGEHCVRVARKARRNLKAPASAPTGSPAPIGGALAKGKFLMETSHTSPQIAPNQAPSKLINY
ncbi:OLC1v1007859C1 [Oldenlandia corymbosa var. corymbosa]|uniref:OLC1v1007859C1 n=1 Tax=Oldenlandia corymbosa var. corymbosa TaxID=529605 RepID=A0AAV1DKF5_OLDCO|nr:OLC1v1007859C1 [Oldenlandia corymbosa var. corymbosa]